jgi:DNA-binding SARP family transcriptional activator/tetratricopeptide (TPR) repeat protein
VPAATLRLALLGAPIATLDGRELAVDTRKATALLAYLAVEGGAHRRSTLAGVLWPDVDEERARAALRRTLSTLRNALRGEFVRVTRDIVELDRSGVDLDVTRFRELAATGTVAGCDEAARLHRGPFMAGFGLRDSAAFDDWQSLQSGNLSRELGAVLDALTAGLEREGELDRAIEQARRRLALDPLHEPAHRRLMELYARSGERGAALSQYRDCVRVLHRELGVSPLEATTELYRSIREGVVAPPADDGRAPAAAAPAHRAFVGRGPETTEARRAFDAVGPDGRLLVVEGEAGIGKSRFVAELAAWAASRASPVAVARAFEGESGLAYGTAVELLRAALRAGSVDRVKDAAREEAARLVPELGPPAARPLDDPGARTRFYDGVVATLVESLDGPRALLVVDDVHWADAASLELVAYLARRLAGRPVLIVLTWRPEETASGHPARAALRRAQADGRASVLQLGRLTRSEVAELARRDELSPEQTDRLYAETDGVPFFVCEYLDAGAGDWTLPAGVRELVETRLATTSDIAGQVLAAGSVLGRSFDSETVRKVSGRSDDEVVAALEELVARGVLVEREDASYDFRHEQTRSVAYERTSTGRKRLLHGRAADVLAADARGETTASVVGQHLQLAGREPEAAEWYVAAGTRAHELRANAEARAHFEEALALGHADGARLHRSIGDLSTLDGRYGDALRSYEAAAALADAEDRAEIEHRIGLVHHRRGEWQLADAAFETALELTHDDDVTLRARVLADRSLTAHRMARDAEANELATQALELATHADDGRAAAQAHNILGILAGGRGDLGAARAHAERSLELAETLADDAARIAALNNLALVDRADGELDQALELTEKARRLCAIVGDRHREAALANNMADLLHAVGRGEEAMATLKDAVAMFAEIGDADDLEPEIWKLREW